MNKRPDFVHAWKRADEAIAAAAAPSRRLDARVEASLHRAFPVRSLLLVASAAAIAVVLFAISRKNEQGPIPGDDLATFTPASCAPAIANAELSLAPGCIVERPPVTIEARSAVRLSRTTQGIRLIEGTATFNVEPSAMLFVSGGHIEAAATRFVVEESGESGKVTLEHGRIAFIALDGRRAELQPGAVHTWSKVQHAARREEPATVVEEPAIVLDPVPTEPRKTREKPVEVTPELTPEITPPEVEARPPPAAWSAEQTARAVEEVSELRAKGRYQEALRLIEQLLQAPLAARAREVLSFERGEILEHKLGLHAEACAHWRSHQLRFGGGRYESEVQRALSLCQETP